MHSALAALAAVFLFTAPALASAVTFETVPTPNPNPERTLLRGISGSSATDVWAVGDSRVTDVLDRHLILHWDGHSWSETAAPQVNDAEHMLFNVSVLTPDLAWAAGLYAEGAGLASGYILRWDGTRWALDFNHPGWAIFDIRAIGPNDVWAVGINNDPLARPPLALHWDGSSWTRIDPPVVGNRNQELDAVHASATDNVWAVGSYRNITSLAYLAYVVRWNGSRWDHVPLETAAAHRAVVRVHEVRAVAPAGDDVVLERDVARVPDHHVRAREALVVVERVDTGLGAARRR